MTDQIREQVSALLDGELPRDEIGLLVRRMERDPELRRSFGSYSLIGETLRAPGGLTARPSFAARVSAAIDAPESGEVADAPAVAPSPAFWRRPAFATAVAASVAVAGFLLVQPFTTTSPTSPVAQPVLAYRAAASPTPAQSQRLAGYLVAHSQFSSPMGRRSVWSGLLAADPSLQRVAYEIQDAP
jgi:sigma-E factor negative regulatory protein RseA